MTPIKAGIVLRTRFVDKQLEQSRGKSNTTKTIETFRGYIDYINRNEAVRNTAFQKYSLYNDYMDNPLKTSGLFTTNKDSLTADEKEALKRAFETAYHNDGIMWQTVISFDNRFLVKQGLYDPFTRTVNEDRLRECARNAMREFLRSEGMERTAVWSASIHFNPDHIHIHIAATEPVPTRKRFVYEGRECPRGTIKGKTLKAMKSKAANTFLERDHQLLDELVRERMVGGKKSMDSFSDPVLREMFVKIYTALPSDRRQWFYRMNGIAFLRPELDKMTLYYLKTYRAKEFTAFQKTVLKEAETMRELYGENSRYRDYIATRTNDLMVRMGNAILSEMREYSKHDILYNRMYLQHTGKNPASKSQSLDNLRLNAAMYGLRRSLDATLRQKRGNQNEYEQMIYNMEH